MLGFSDEFVDEMQNSQKPWAAFIDKAMQSTKLEWNAPSSPRTCKCTGLCPCHGRKGGRKAAKITIRHRQQPPVAESLAPAKLRNTSVKANQVDTDDRSIDEILLEMGFTDDKKQSNDNVAARSPTAMEDSKKKKKKKKKKAHHRQNNSHCNPDEKPVAQPQHSSKINSSSNNTMSQKHDSAQVSVQTVVLEKGFTNEQFDRAVAALGGNDESLVADKIISWILKNGPSRGGHLPAAAKSSSEGKENVVRSIESTSDKKKMLFCTPVENTWSAQPKRDSTSAVTAQREKEAKGVAERLAAKREERRRLRLEWNRREECRRREESLAKVAKEMKQLQHNIGGAERQQQAFVNSHDFPSLRSTNTAELSVLEPRDDAKKKQTVTAVASDDQKTVSSKSFDRWDQRSCSNTEQLQPPPGFQPSSPSLYPDSPIMTPNCTGGIRTEARVFLPTISVQMNPLPQKEPTTTISLLEPHLSRTETLLTAPYLSPPGQNNTISSGNDEFTAQHALGSLLACI